MGRRGPPRVPTTQLAQRGSWLAKVRAGEEPQVEVCVPDCPSWLSDEAKKFWPDLAQELAAMGVMGRPYTIALGLLVDALASYISAKRILSEEGGVIVTSQGKVAHPAAAQAAGAWDRVLKAAKEFGMTPASKSLVKLGSGKAKGGDEKDKSRYFNKNRTA